MKKSIQIISGQILDDNTFISLADLCHISHLSSDEILEMVAYGLIEPIGDTVAQWRFPLIVLKRLKLVMRLQHDLELNLAGAILLTEVLEELHQLRRIIENTK